MSFINYDKEKDLVPNIYISILVLSWLCYVQLIPAIKQLSNHELIEAFAKNSCLDDYLICFDIEKLTTSYHIPVLKVMAKEQKVMLQGDGPYLEYFLACMVPSTIFCWNILTFTP